MQFYSKRFTFKFRKVTFVISINDIIAMELTFRDSTELVPIVVQVIVSRKSIAQLLKLVSVGSNQM